MTALFKLQILSYKKIIYEGSVVSVTIPGQQGYLCVTKNHLPIVGGLKPGILSLQQESHDEKECLKFTISQGFFELDEQGCRVFIGEEHRAVGVRSSSTNIYIK